MQVPTLPSARPSTSPVTVRFFFLFLLRVFFVLTPHVGAVKEYEKIKAYGVDFIGCISVNDAWVMTAWVRRRLRLAPRCSPELTSLVLSSQNKSLDGEGKIVMICDPEAKFTKALNLVQNIKILGDRSLRYAMIVEDGVIVDIKVEDPGKFECSRASDIITLLEAQKK